MTLRLPLLGKILGWLTLNLLFLVVAIGLLFMVEFPVDSLLLELMGDRPQRAADLLMAELRTRSHVDRFANAVRLRAVSARSCVSRRIVQKPSQYRVC